MNTHASPVALLPYVWSSSCCKMTQEAPIIIGILAMQGAFAEHQVMLQKVRVHRPIKIALIRQAEDLVQCDGLIIPGGESTTIALLARLAGLTEPLREFVQNKPVWGTCAGAILLSRDAEGMKKGGQELLGGVDIKTARNGWGSQVESFEAPLYTEGLRESNRPFTGIFIRAPVITDITPSALAPPVQIVARLSTGLLPKGQQIVSIDEDDTDPRDARTVVALRQGRHLVTTFHPELTKDDRFHEFFVKQCVLPSLEERTK
ncbi:glutamine amidotransferase subunit pdxT [Fomitiporia mediterranea MF3/22]|uniref:glutamine amidotransferase subunit pdxT n=1 Tax=Fomitiporia mediterranea (strain MF3/22) TaxID=694068 RepID=UPI0004407682|nr:glutamine amidotransferase subunit pdxT [Fomitiporia mediterranea MF3/22]EJD00737.1 glutamine amidotransferase subunit pdxT [Fomitiporia mediterranea MF3/22]